MEKARYDYHKRATPIFRAFDAKRLGLLELEMLGDVTFVIGDSALSDICLSTTPKETSPGQLPFV